MHTAKEHSQPYVDFERLYIALGAILFTLAFLWIDWPERYEAIYGYPMMDRWVYEYTLLTNNLSIDYIHEFNGLMYFTHEWTWQTALSYLNREIGLTPDEIFYIVSFFIVARSCYLVWTEAGWRYTLLLLNPLFVDLACSQIRIGFAMAITSFVWKGQRNIASTLALYLLATSIHTATLLFAVAHLAANIFKGNKVAGIASLFFCGALISLVTGPFREFILSSLNDRRVDYENLSSSLPYLSFWIVSFFIIGLCIKRNNHDCPELNFSFVVMSIVFVNVLTAGYSLRFLSVVFHYFLISMKKLGPQWEATLMSLFIPYTALQWVYWLRLLS